MKLVDYPAVAGARRVHGLLGGKGATDGRYFLATWCGVELRNPRLALAASGEAVTCRSCQRARDAHEKRWSGKGLDGETKRGGKGGGRCTSI